MQRYSISVTMMFGCFFSRSSPPLIPVGFHVTVWQVDYLKSRHLGGAAVWTLDMDDFSGQFCGQGKYPLISHLKHKLSEGETSGLCLFFTLRIFIHKQTRTGALILKLFQKVCRL